MAIPFLFEEPVDLFGVFSFFREEVSNTLVFLPFIVRCIFKLVSWTSVRPNSYRESECEYTEKLCEHHHYIQELFFFNLRMVIYFRKGN